MSYFIGNTNKEVEHLLNKNSSSLIAELTHKLLTKLARSPRFRRGGAPSLQPAPYARSVPYLHLRTRGPDLVLLTRRTPKTRPWALRQAHGQANSRPRTGASAPALCPSLVFSTPFRQSSQSSASSLRFGLPARGFGLLARGLAQAPPARARLPARPRRA